jgi:hypothetical protein
MPCLAAAHEHWLLPWVTDMGCMGLKTRVGGMAHLTSHVKNITSWQGQAMKACIT